MRADTSKDDPDAVASVLNRYLSDNDSYSNKRVDTSYLSITSKDKFDDDKQNTVRTTIYSRYAVWGILPCSNSLFISSYFGVSYADMAKDVGHEREWRPTVFGPVGVEMKLATGNLQIISIIIECYAIRYRELCE